MGTSVMDPLFSLRFGVEARRLEHYCPDALETQYREGSLEMGEIGGDLERCIRFDITLPLGTVGLTCSPCSRTPPKSW